MKTLQVTLNSVVVGQRKTDRPYTHALVAHSFREAEYRERIAKGKHTSHYTPEYLDKVCAARKVPSVISYHGSYELAIKAAGAKNLEWMCSSISISPVIEKAAKARKTAAGTEPSVVG
jgi:hypothetical protein